MITSAFGPLRTTTIGSRTDGARSGKALVLLARSGLSNPLQSGVGIEEDRIGDPGFARDARKLHRVGSILDDDGRDSPATPVHDHRHAVAAMSSDLGALWEEGT